MGRAPLWVSTLVGSTPHQTVPSLTRSRQKPSHASEPTIGPIASPHLSRTPLGPSQTARTVLVSALSRAQSSEELGAAQAILSVDLDVEPSLSCNLQEELLAQAALCWPPSYKQSKEHTRSRLIRIRQTSPLCYVHFLL